MFSSSVYDDFSLVLDCKHMKEFRVVAREGETVYLKRAALRWSQRTLRLLLASPQHEGLPSLMGRRLAPSAAASRCESQSFMRRSIVQTHTCVRVSSMLCAAVQSQRAWLPGCLHLEVLRLSQQGCCSFPGSRSVSGWWLPWRCAQCDPKKTQWRLLNKPLILLHHAGL